MYDKNWLFWNNLKFCKFDENAPKSHAVEIPTRNLVGLARAHAHNILQVF